MKEITIEMPEAVKEIIGTLENAGFEAFAVGGCVRDALLHRTPADWDVTTSARPEEVKALFGRTIDTGIRHGTVTVMKNHTGYEITTYRIDGEYEDARHPKEVSFTSNLIEDLKRRDFTINAMAYNDRAGLVDAFDGIEDLKNGIIRCVGDAKERFGEDALRMLRAIRFSAQLGFAIEKETGEAIAALAQNLEKISAERIQTELVKLLLSDHPDYLRAAYETGITAVIMPEFDACMKQEQDPAHSGCSVGEHTLKALTAVEKDRVLRLTMLFHDFGKPLSCSRAGDGSFVFYGHAKLGERLVAEIMHRLKFDNDTSVRVRKLVAEHDCRISKEPEAVRRAMARLGRELFPYFLKVRRADLLAQNPQEREEGLAELARLTELYEEILIRADAVSVKELAVNGRDLLDAGIAQGKQLGETLDRLLDAVLKEPQKNKKEILLEMVAREMRG